MTRRALLAAALLALTGCAWRNKPPPAPAPAAPAPPPPPPPELDATLEAAPELNPDAQGRASPLVLRLYELKSLGGFEGAGFLALYEHGADTLGAAFVAGDELRLRPGERRVYRRPLDPATRFVGLVGAYRDLERARWRAWLAVAPHGSTSVTISAGQRALAVLAG